MNKRPVLKFYEGDDTSAPRVTGVPVFREGVYAPQGKYTAKDVQEMADTYDPAFLEAPLTPDHIQDGPAWGWWERFYTVNTPEGLELYGDCTLLWQGEYMWKTGAYKRRSIEIYRDLEMPDGTEVHYVRAVSLLGSATPAVKGLQNMFNALPMDTQLMGHPAFINHDARRAVSAKAFSIDSPEILPGTKVPETPALPETAADTTETEEHNMDPKDKKADPPAFVQVDAAQFAEMQAGMKAMTDAAQTFKEQAETFQKQAEEARAALAKESESRKTAEAAAFTQSENKRFDDAVKANRAKVSPAIEKRLRALFHASPPDADTDRHVSFKDGANDRTLSMRGLVLECMSAGSPVIDLDEDPDSDNAAAEHGTAKVPVYGTSAFSDQVDTDAKNLMEKNPDKFKTYSDAADQAHRNLMQRQPSEVKNNFKRRAIPKAAE